MFFGIMFAFGVAVVNWIITRFIGFRFLSHMAQQTTFVMVPPLFLIFLVLGTIFIGVATPTEGGAMGASGALILGAAQAPADTGTWFARPSNPPPNCRPSWSSS